MGAEQGRSRSRSYAEEQRRRQQRKQQQATGRERRAELSVERGEIHDQDDQLRQAQDRAAQQRRAQRLGGMAIRGTQVTQAAGQTALRAAAQQQAQTQQRAQSQQRANQQP